MSVEVSLSGRSALVTGGGTGIGFGIARRLLQAGARVTIAGRRQEVLETAASELEADAGDGASVAWTRCDVTVEEEVEAAVAAAADSEGRLDIAVANAGSGSPGPILAQTPESWRYSFDINILGSAMTIKHAALCMKDAGRGAIVTISSQSALRPTRWMAPYTVTKAGLDALVHCAAQELAPFGIRVNGIRPGLVMSESVSLVFDDDMREALTQRTLLGRPGEAEEVGDGVLYLVSDLSSWVTGQVMNVCGGITASDHDDFSGLCRRMLGDEAFEALTRPRDDDRER